MKKESSIVGCLLGVAVGDALGLPYEGVSAKRLPKLLGAPDRYRFVFGKGMISDDTEHSCLVAESLIASNFRLEAFEKEFAWRLKVWMAGLPAGTGKATAKSCIKLWLGFSTKKSGVFSAGNGPAMRAAIFGTCFDKKETMLSFLKVASEITHSDPKAYYGAIAIALAAHFAANTENVNGWEYLELVRNYLPTGSQELEELLVKAAESAQAGQTTKQFAESLGLGKGVSGYTYHTVPVAIHAWLVNPDDFENAVKTAIECGGDSDTTAAIVGGIVGASVGREGIEKIWLDGIRDWPRSVAWIEKLGQKLAQASEGKQVEIPKGVAFPKVFVRNMWFLAIVLLHGFRRLLPPY